MTTAQDGEDAPRADWYGLLREEDARKLLDVALQPESDVWWNRWRGRVGMTPEQVKDAYLEGTSGEPAAAKKRKEKVRSELGDPIELLFRSWDGRDEYRVKGYEGESVMVRFRVSPFTPGNAADALDDARRRLLDVMTCHRY